MNDQLAWRLFAIHGPDHPVVQRHAAALDVDHPLNLAIAASVAASEARAEARAHAGVGSPVERIAALEARVAALEEGA